MNADDRANTAELLSVVYNAMAAADLSSPFLWTIIVAGDSSDVGVDLFARVGGRRYGQRAAWSIFARYREGENMEGAITRWVRRATRRIRTEIEAAQ